MTQTRRIPWPQIALVAIVALTALCPGDAPWVNDEPILMEMALQYNHTGSDIYGFSMPFTPCPFGLQGTRGARYGPLPVWLNQLGLTLTHNIVVIVALRAIVFSALTAIALSHLARTLRLSPWIAVLTMISPFLWFFSRSLWDSTWCIPLSAGLFAAYASFLHRPTGSALCIAVLCWILLPLVHLVAVAIVLPLGIHFLFFHSRAIWKWKWTLASIVAACLYLFRPYLTFFFTHTQPSFPQNHSPLLGWLFPLLGGHYLTLGVAGTVPGDGWQQYAPNLLRLLVAIAQWVARLALVSVWIGMVLATPRAWRALRLSNAATRDHLCLIALAVWVCQTILDGLERLYFSPHYYVATWIVYVFFAWIAMDWLINPARNLAALVHCLVGAYAACIVTGMSIIFSTIARNAGTHGVYYGTCIGNQIQAVERIGQFSDQSAVDIDFPNWRLYPLAMKVLMELNPPPRGPRPIANLVVKYRNFYPGDARIEVIASPLRPQ